LIEGAGALSRNAIDRHLVRVQPYERFKLSMEAKGVRSWNEKPMFSSHRHRHALRFRVLRNEGRPGERNCALTTDTSRIQHEETRPKVVESAESGLSRLVEHRARLAGAPVATLLEEAG